METSIELLKFSSYKFPSIIYYPFPNKNNFLENSAYPVRSKIDQLLFPIILDHLLVCIVC